MSTTRAGNNAGKRPSRRLLSVPVLFGYARVSTPDQNSAHQIDALHHADVAEENIYLDVASGAKASLPQLDLLLKLLRATP